MPFAPPSLITGAPRVSLPYGLFSVLTLRTGGRWGIGVQFETGTCDPVQGIGEWDCGDPRQVLSYTGSPGSGTWTITYGGETTDALAINATPLQVANALNAIGADVSVTGTAGVAYTVQFLNNDNPAQLVPADTFNQGDVSVLAGGSTTGSTVGLPKTLTSNTGGVGVASQFTVYGHFQCSPVGYSQADAQDRATAHLLAREEARVEQAFWTGDLGNFPALADPAAVDVTVGALSSVGQAIGALEDWLGVNYGSLGVIHMTRGAATAAAATGLIAVSGGRLSTRLGTPVVAGAGYPGSSPAGVAPAEGTSWIYGSPALFGYRSDVFDSSARPGDLFDRTQNNLFAVAERSYLLGFDPCGVAAALADTSFVVNGGQP